MDDERLLIVAVPSLTAVLLNEEEKKGAPLSQDEVLAIRDSAACIAMPACAAAAVAEGRGYDDIGLETAWEDWCAIRPTLHF